MFNKERGNRELEHEDIEELISFVKFHECHSSVNLFATVRVQENLLWSAWMRVYFSRMTELKLGFMLGSIVFSQQVIKIDKL